MDDKYVLPRNDLERRRLKDQHAFLTTMLGGRLVFDKSLKFGPEDRVLDSGTGAASWIFDLLDVVPKTVELIGVDISTAMFPNEVPSSVKLYEMSSLNLPANWTNSFDLVNQRLLIAAFNMSQWLATISELYRVLKPGGAIQLLEAGEYGSLHESQSLPATKKAYDFSVAIFRKRGLLGKECGGQLPLLLRQVGFTDVQVEILRAPLGKQWGDVGLLGSKNWDTLFRTFGLSCLAEGGLGVCESQAEVEVAVDRAKAEWDEIPGVFIRFYAITARKPLRLTHM